VTASSRLRSIWNVVRTPLAIAGVWTLLTLLAFMQGAVSTSLRGQGPPLGRMALVYFADWYTCAIFTPVFFWLARRVPIDRRRWRNVFLVYLPVSVVCVVLKYSAFVPIRHAIAGGPESLRLALTYNAVFELMIMWAVIGVVHAVVFYRRYVDREQLAATLRAQLTEAQLEVLREQLRPHFLFNALNSVSTLLHRDPQAADDMIVELSDLLRASLEHRGAHEHALSDEISLVKKYLSIMRHRFEDRLVAEVRVDDSVRDALVPQFLLQPLVENALEHGIARRAGAGCVVVAAAARGEGERENELWLSVTDDGPSSPTGLRFEEGVGLSNTRRRLEELYGDRQRLSVGAAERGVGTRVTVVLPLRTQRAAAPDDEHARRTTAEIGV
jgi:two-component system, LytTR family, sensor kinase